MTNTNLSGNEETSYAPAVGAEQLRRAHALLSKYKAGKAALEQRILENERWYKLRHWDCMRRGTSEVEPASAWLFNCIANKHASAMDSMPAPCVLPREESDRDEAKMLSAIIPVILAQNDFEQVYSDAWDHKCRFGTAVYGVFWDSSKLSGLGDIAVRDIDILSLYWEPGVRDIQDSQNVFSVQLTDTDLLLDTYPFLEGKLSGAARDFASYVSDEAVDLSEKTAVIDWYYKKRQGGRTVLHYCKFAGDCVIYATENDPLFALRGLYDHAMYPFIFDALFPTPGTPAGFGYIDIGKNCQSYIDRGGQAVMKNLLANAAPRILVSDDSVINEQEYCDLSVDVVHAAGALTDNTVRPLPRGSLDSVYITALRDKVDELKETTGNRDVSTGGTSSGVTAASAIAAMQEAGSKLDRDSCKASYRAFRRICLMIVELIRQFYSVSRCFRITGEDGGTDFVSYTNTAIVPQQQSVLPGTEPLYRTPLFDIEITAEKASPYSRMAQNEMALQFYGNGFFDPERAEQALACLEMMDFDRKNTVMRSIAAAGDRYKSEQEQRTFEMLLAASQQNPEPESAAHSDSSHKSTLSSQSGRAYRSEAAATQNARMRYSEK